ncbi:MAG TPA: transglycosylase domain-containing protein [Mycobacteriales bacterium]|nr:transglycosylase domain-containing protein [Mycobacteriales bacterium]
MTTSPVLARIAAALVLSVLAGICLAGLLFPLVGTVGMVGKRGADDFLALPAKLDTPALAQRSRILDRNGKVLATLFTENRLRVTLGQVPQAAQDALIAIEDSRFREHRGIDVKGTVRALARNSSSGEVQQGGSTLTQQYVKNVLIESALTEAGRRAAREKSVHRKLQEARYALALEETMTKDQILEGYLNIAYFGNGVYGIGTAAAHYWGVSVGKLTLAQGALLAGMVQNPKRYDPQDNPKASVARRNVVLNRMRELGYISAEQAFAASRAGLGLRIRTVRSGCEAPGVTAPFFCDYVRRYLEDGPAGSALGATRQERQAVLLAGGLTIRTTLDPKVQQAAQGAVDKQVPRNDPFGAAAVADVVEPGTGAVRAMAVDRGFGSGKGQTKVNLALGGSLGFFPGSTFKVFTLARAIQMGISPRLTLRAPQSYCPKAFTYVLADGSCPSNAGDSESGTFTMAKATWESVNTYYLQLAERTGIDAPLGLAEAMGVRRVGKSFSGDPLQHYPSSIIGGADGVSPLAMAGAYASIAARGQYCPPNPITAITDNENKPLSLPSTPCTQVLEPENADTVTSILRGVIDGPAPGRTGKGASIGRPAAGKTGTTDESKAAWFVGYTPQLATAVWVGKPTPTPMRGVRINGRHYKAVYGGSLPAPIWRQVMINALKGVAPVDFVAPPKASTGTKVGVPDVRGLSVEAANEQLRAAGFGVVVGAAVNGAPVPVGAVAFTRPAAGTQVPAGSSVTVHPSNGREPVAPPAPTLTPSPTPSPPGNGPPPPPPSTASPTPSPTKKRGPG